MRLLVLGAGGHGKVVADVGRAGGHTLAGFIDADAAKLGLVVEPGGGAVIAIERALLAGARDGEPLPGSADAVALGVGNNVARLLGLGALGTAVAPALLHPSAVVSPSARLGPGTVVMPLAVVNAAAVIGAAVILNTGAIVEHDCVLADGVHVSPRATLTGGVRVGARSWIGAGAVVLPGVRIGSDARVGAGAVVVRDVADGATVVGVPAAPISRRGT